MPSQFTTLAEIPFCNLVYFLSNDTEWNVFDPNPKLKLNLKQGTHYELQEAIYH